MSRRSYSLRFVVLVESFIDSWLGLPSSRPVLAIDLTGDAVASRSVPDCESRGCGPSAPWSGC